MRQVAEEFCRPHTDIVLLVRCRLNEEPWVTHLTSQLSGKKTIPFSELLDTRRIVHQYKWANSVKEHYLNQYGYVV